jgi:hypothetical protein
MRLLLLLVASLAALPAAIARPRTSTRATTRPSRPRPVARMEEAPGEMSENLDIEDQFRSMDDLQVT